tara:strand:+ start:518 stop:1672 length:1155 start_codon:yes stop_codon:yes gene_type:complete
MGAVTQVFDAASGKKNICEDRKKLNCAVPVDGWEIKQVGQISTLQRGFDLPTRLRKHGTVPIITSSGVGEFHNEAKASSPGVVTGRYGTIGEVFFLKEDFWPLNTTLYVSDFHGNDPLFVYYFLKCVDFKTHSGKSGVPGVNRNDIHGVLAKIPSSRTEQQSIAKALSDADALIEGLEKLIAKKRHIKQGAMQELLTGKHRLPGFDGEWRETTLGEIAHIKTGSRNNQDKAEGAEYPFFVRSECVERIDTFSYDCEAILIPGEGGIGSIFHYINGRFDAHQRVYVISQFSDDVVGQFVHLFMKQYFGLHAMQNTVKATVDSLRLPTFQNFTIRLPVTVDEQRAIAMALSNMDDELCSLGNRLSKARQIKQGMMQELLTGRIRLV